MIEFERAKGGLPHIFDTDMMQMFKRACALTQEYNLTGEDEVHKREKILAQLLGHAGENLYIIPDFHCEHGSNINIGDDVIINTHCMLMDNAEITIGDHVLIGPNVSLYTVNHALDPDERAQGICIAKPIHIGNQVWIGGDVQIAAGVTIGDGSVIGAGSVVTKDIPSRVIAAGNPCRVIRAITEQDKIGYTPKGE
ncbi:MAG: sugar O-acetyltransferase [Clostridia bacterium]|nr:sugar O-acetyltransferase [Lachnospiraceae bacterium]NCC00167.1 sugar O-acetyltransferase [Clostridia bacterium]NCD03410.1 sugar O-acetyltransferase [Clostridia bacterium]